MTLRLPSLLLLCIASFIRASPKEQWQKQRQQ